MSNGNIFVNEHKNKNRNCLWNKNRYFGVRYKSYSRIFLEDENVTYVQSENSLTYISLLSYDSGPQSSLTNGISCRAT